MNPDLQERTELLSQLSGLSERLSALGANEEDLGRLGTLIEEAKRREFRLAVVGASSRGKSTLLNALLGRELMKSGVLPTTAAAVEFRQSDKFRIITVEVSGLDKIEDFRDLKTLRNRLAELSEQKPGSEAVAITRLQVDCPWDTPVDGLTLVDTPGLGSNHSKHDQITAEEVTNADAVLFLVAADPGLSDKEQHFYRTQIQARASAKTLCILTKVDQLRGQDEIEEQSDYVCKELGIRESHLVTVSLKGCNERHSNPHFDVIKQVWAAIAAEIIPLGSYQARKESLKHRVRAFAHKMRQQIAAERASNELSDRALELEEKIGLQRNTVRETKEALEKRESEAVEGVQKYKEAGLKYSERNYTLALNKIKRTNDEAKMKRRAEEVMNGTASQLCKFEDDAVKLLRAFEIACDTYQSDRMASFERQVALPESEGSGLAPAVGLGALATTGTGGALPAVMMVGAVGLWCGGAIALFRRLRDTSRSQADETREYVIRLLGFTQKAQEDALTKWCDAIKKGIRAAVRDLVEAEACALAALERRSTMFQEKHHATRQRIEAIERALKEFQRCI